MAKVPKVSSGIALSRGSKKHGQDLVFLLFLVFLSLSSLHSWRPSPLVIGQGTWSCVVLDFMQEKFYNMSPGDYEKTFIKVGDNETRKGLV